MQKVRTVFALYPVKGPHCPQSEVQPSVGKAGYIKLAGQVACAKALSSASSPLSCYVAYLLVCEQVYFLHIQVV